MRGARERRPFSSRCRSWRTRGGILLQFRSNSLRGQLVATVAHEEGARRCSAQWGVDVSADNGGGEACDLILLGVKAVSGGRSGVRSNLRRLRDKMLISFATGVKTARWRCCGYRDSCDSLDAEYASCWVWG